MSSKLKYYLPFLVTFSLAVLALLIYAFSGQLFKDQNLSQLKTAPAVQTVQINEAAKSITVICEDGTEYQLENLTGAINYEALKANKCRN